MGETTKIQWCDHTFNPWRGCTKIAPGCANCYADAQSKRNPSVLGIWGPNGTRVVAAEKAWAEPLKWDKAAGEAGVRRRVFCASLADVFEDWRGPVRDSQGRPLHHAKAFGRDGCYFGVDGLFLGKSIVTLDDVRARLFALIDSTPNLDWILVTKRPQNVRRMWAVTPFRAEFGDYRPNVWLLTSVSDQATANAMIPELLQCRDLAPVLGVSYEPALGPVDWWEWLDRLDWIIVGSESGHKRRPMDAEWAASTARQCREAGIAFFMKQMEVAGRVTGDIECFPEHLRVREWPAAKGGA